MLKVKYFKYLLLAAMLLASTYIYAKKSGKPTLLQAIQQNDMTTFTRLLKGGTDVNAPDSNGATPLMWAAYTGNLTAFKTLIKKGADATSKGVIYTDSTRKNYLGNIACIAAARNDAVLLGYCLDSLHLYVDEKEYDPESRQDDGWTALQWASCQGSLDAIDILLKHGANGNTIYAKDGKNALMIAVASGQYRTCLNLLESGYLQISDTLLQKAYDSAYHGKKYTIALMIDKWKKGDKVNRLNLLLDSVLTMNTWGNLADSCRKKGNNNCAVEYKKKELNYCYLIFGEIHPKYTGYLEDFAKLCKELGKNTDATLSYQKAIEIKKITLGENHPDYAMSLNSLAGIYENMGNYTEALPLCRKALEIFRIVLGEAHPYYATSLNNMAGLYKNMGNYTEALPLYKKALEIYRTTLGETHTDYATSLNNLAIINRYMGDYVEALPLYKKALEIKRITLGETHPDYATSLNNLASLYHDIGNYVEALPLKRKALEIRKTALGEMHPDYAISLNNLASLYHDMGKYADALPLKRKALEINRIALGEMHPYYAMSLNNLAGLYDNMGNYVEALPLYKKALEIRKTALGETHPDYAASLQNIAGLYKSMGKYVEALPLYKKSLEVYKTALGETHPNYALFLNNLAILYRNMGDYTMALPLFQQSLHLLIRYLQNGSSFMGEEMMMQFINADKHRFAIARSVALHTADTSLVNLSLQGELQLKGLALQNSKDLLAQISHTEDTALQQAIQHFKILRDKLAKAWQSNTPIGQTDSLARLLANDEQQLIRQSPEYQKLIKNRNIQWQQVQQKLQPREAALEFVKFNYWNKKWTDTTMYAAFILLPQGQPRMVSLCTQKVLEQRINDILEKNEQYVKQLYQVVDRGVQLSGAPADSIPSLYQLLWQPLDSLLTGVSTIYYAPTGLLHRINLAAISYSGKKVLGDKYAFHLLGSTRDRVTYQPEYINIKSDTLLLYGGIDFDADSSTLATQHHKFYSTPANENSLALRSGNFAHWPALDGSLEELTTIKDLAAAQHIAARSFTSKEATEESFNYYTEQSKSPALIHIATHGFFFPGTQQRKLPDGSPAPYFISSANAMLRSGIVFAGANRVSEGKEPLQGIEDGITTASDIARANLQQTKLAVLSACETGLGKIESSEGVFGLQRAIRMAGCKNLIMSLWKVPDAQTSLFMNYFYTALLQQKKSIYDSFQGAQKQMRTLYSGQPYFWAAFVLME